MAKDNHEITIKESSITKPQLPTAVLRMLWMPLSSAHIGGREAMVQLEVKRLPD